MLCEVESTVTEEACVHDDGVKLGNQAKGGDAVLKRGLGDKEILTN